MRRELPTLISTTALRIGPAVEALSKRPPYLNRYGAIKAFKMRILREISDNQGESVRERRGSQGLSLSSRWATSLGAYPP